MRTLKTIFAVTLLSLGLAGVSHAALYMDTNFDLKHISSSDQTPYTNTFELKNFDPATEEITKASVFFTFVSKTRENTRDMVTISAGLDNVMTWGSLWVIDWAWGKLSGSLAALNQDGKLTYSVTAKDGDVFLATSTLIACANPRQVPDTSFTLALFGAALLGIAAFRKRTALR